MPVSGVAFIAGITNPKKTRSNSCCVQVMLMFRTATQSARPGSLLWQPGCDRSDGTESKIKPLHLAGLFLNTNPQGEQQEWKWGKRPWSRVRGFRQLGGCQRGRSWSGVAKTFDSTEEHNVRVRTDHMEFMSPRTATC